MAVEAKMKQILENWKRYLIEDMYEPKTITFDFDNTIMMTRPDEDWVKLLTVQPKILSN